MTAIKGTNVAAPVVPFDSLDVYPTHEDQYGLGGYRSVADNTARDAIPPDRRNQGMLVYSIAAATTYQLGADLTTWTAYTPGSVARRYDIGIYFPGKPTASQFIAEIAMVTTVVFVISLTGSKFAIRSVPTATQTFTFLKNGASIGSVSFNTSGVASVTFASAVTFSAGDVFGIQAQLVPDATGSDISFTIVGSI